MCLESAWAWRQARARAALSGRARKDGTGDEQHQGALGSERHTADQASVVGGGASAAHAPRARWLTPSDWLAAACASLGRKLVRRSVPSPDTPRLLAAHARWQAATHTRNAACRVLCRSSSSCRPRLAAQAEKQEESGTKRTRTVTGGAKAHRRCRGWAPTARPAAATAAAGSARRATAPAAAATRAAAAAARLAAPAGTARCPLPPTPMPPTLGRFLRKKQSLPPAVQRESQQGEGTTSRLIPRLISSGVRLATAVGSPTQTLPLRWMRSTACGLPTRAKQRFGAMMSAAHLVR